MNWFFGKLIGPISHNEINLYSLFIEFECYLLASHMFLFRTLGLLIMFSFLVSLVIIFQFLTLSLHIWFLYNIWRILKNYVFYWTEVESLEKRVALPKMIILNVKFMRNTEWKNVFWNNANFIELLVENINKCHFYMFCNIQKLIFIF